MRGRQFLGGAAVAAASLALALGQPAAAQDVPPKEPAPDTRTAEQRAERFEALLAELSKQLATVKTLRCRFEQEKYLEVFEDVVTSDGTLALSVPGKLRWEYVRPVRSVLVVDGRRAQRERTSRKGVRTRKTYSLDDEPITAITAEQVFLWTRGDFVKARESHDLALVTEKPLVIRATPKEARVREVVSAVELTFADDRKALTGVTLVEKDQARTVVTFLDVEVNPVLPDALFAIGE
jgi:outer membrane lipoprotein-sorting protein